jgi:hypothetical protein
VVRCSETSVNFCKSVRRRVPEECYEKFKFERNTALWVCIALYMNITLQRTALPAEMILCKRKLRVVGFVLFHY